MANGTDKLEKMIAALAENMAEMQRSQAEMQRTQATHQAANVRMFKALATDVGTLKKDVAELKVTQTRQYKHLTGELESANSAIRQLQSDQSTLASAVSMAVSQLALAQTILKRLDRLEAAVFPAKH